MNLSELIAVGSIDDGYELVSVKWQKTPDDTDNKGNVTKEGEVVEFDVLAKREMSCADYEHIYLGTGRQRDSEGNILESDDDGVMARRVHRMCKWPSDSPDKPSEHIPEDVARRFKTSLLLALCSALSSVNTPLPSDADVKKN